MSWTRFLASQSVLLTRSPCFSRLLLLTSVVIWYDAVIGLVLGIAISLVFFVIEYA